MFESTIHLVTLLGTAHAVMPSLNPLEVSNLCVWMPILFLDLVDVRDSVDALHLGPTRENNKAKLLEHYLSRHYSLLPESPQGRW